MYYSSFAVLAIILHLILNQRILRTPRNEVTSESRLKYRHFVVALFAFYVADGCWGVFEEAKIVPLTYADTVVFFGSMALSLLLWTRYVSAYVNKKRLRSKSFVAAGWVIFTGVLVGLAVNIYYPVFFSFAEDGTYTPYFGRNILLWVQVALFVVISLYAQIVSGQTEGGDRTRYRAVFASGWVMALFIILQGLAPFLPFYTIGCLIANTVLHIFIEEDHQREQERIVRDVRTKQRNSITFGQIAESLASNYDVIYYVDLETEDYVGFTTKNIYGQMKIEDHGINFFFEAQKNLEILVHPGDQEKTRSVMNKDFILSSLEGRRQFTYEYRLLVNDEVEHARLSVRKASDGFHIIIGVENVEEEVQKENERLKVLNSEKELARRDELTGTRNKTAFMELEESVQISIEKGVADLTFAIVLCDLNDLKKINDTQGHKAGDDYIMASAKIICDLFDHSPVFRVGGDEFAIFLRGSDYLGRAELIEKLHQISLQNKELKEGPVIAAGLAEYEPTIDSKFEEVFERADRLMYEDKRYLKNLTV